MEETTYWNYFQTVRFSVQLSKDFETQLVIPKRFTENIRKKLPEKIFLKGPSIESHSWEVLLSTSNNTTSIIGEGWKEFVTAYSLKENDFLVFKYKNNAYFKVSMFDAQNCGVEKESSYFVKKCTIVPKSSDHNENRKEISLPDLNVLTEKNEESDQNPRRVDAGEPVFEFVSLEVEEDYLDDEVEIVTPNKRKIDDPEWTLAKRTKGEHCDGRDATCLRNVGEERLSRVIRRPRSRDPLVWPRSATNARRGTFFLNSNSKCEMTSRKRYPTDREKARAQKLAFQESANDNFFTVLLPSHVSHKSCKLTIPKLWSNKYMSASNQDVILRLNGQENKEWHVRYNFNMTKFAGKLTGGWINFVRDNGLHEFDVCVFKLAGRKDGYVCLDVKIIRAIEEETDEFRSGSKSGQDTQERGALHRT